MFFKTDVVPSFPKVYNWMLPALACLIADEKIDGHIANDFRYTCYIQQSLAYYSRTAFALNTMYIKA